MTRSSCASTASSSAIRRLDRATSDRPVSIDEPRGQLRPAQVDRDHLASAHSGSGYDTRSLWRPRTSRIASTAAGGSRARFRPSRGRAEPAPESATARTPTRGRGRAASAAGALAPDRPRRRPRRGAGRRGLGRARLPRLPQRREGGERATRLRAYAALAPRTGSSSRIPRRSSSSEPTRPRSRGPFRSTRSCSCARTPTSTGSRSCPSRGTCAWRSPDAARQGQRRVRVRRPDARHPHGAGADRDPDQPRGRRQPRASRR